MKKLMTIMLALFAISTAQAQEENAAFYIYQNDGHFDGFFYDEVQKISYSFLDTLGIEHDEVVSQEIVTADSTYRIMLSAIDSVGFVQPEVKYNPRLHNIANDELWDKCFRRFNSSDEIVFYANSWSAQHLPSIGDVYASFNIDDGWERQSSKHRDG